MNQLNQVVFANIDEKEPWTIDSYIASGGYQAVSYTHLTLPTKA